jgi:hypothetical protein
MDIEGAEYDILDKMFIDGTINRVKTIIIEWHDRFMPGKKHSYLTQKLRKLNIAHQPGRKIYRFYFHFLRIFKISLIVIEHTSPG